MFYVYPDGTTATALETEQDRICRHCRIDDRALAALIRDEPTASPSRWFDIARWRRDRYRRQACRDGIDRLLVETDIRNRRTLDALRDLLAA